MKTLRSFGDPQLFGIEDMSLDEQIALLTKLCKEERGRELAGHWTYEVARHRNYKAMLKHAMAIRDIEAIDKAFERAAQRMKAAE